MQTLNFILYSMTPMYVHQIFYYIQDWVSCTVLKNQNFSLCRFEGVNHLKTCWCLLFCILNCPTRYFLCLFNLIIRIMKLIYISKYLVGLKHCSDAPNSKIILKKKMFWAKIVYLEILRVCIFFHFIFKYVANYQSGMTGSRYLN